MSEPAYTRLDVDERRRRLLERGADLFARHSYDELSMAAIAREAGVSKALLYHYFPSKQDYFGAVLAEGAAELVAVVDAQAPPGASSSTRSSAGWRCAEAPTRSSCASRRPRSATSWTRCAPPPRSGSSTAYRARRRRERRVAVNAWLWFMDGAIVDWLEHRDLDRAALRALLLRALEGALGEPL